MFAAAVSATDFDSDTAFWWMNVVILFAERIEICGGKFSSRHGFVSSLGFYSPVMALLARCLVSTTELEFSSRDVRTCASTVRAWCAPLFQRVWTVLYSSCSVESHPAESLFMSLSMSLRVASMEEMIS